MLNSQLYIEILKKLKILMEIQQHIEKVFGIDVVQTITLFWERFYPTNHTERLATYFFIKVSGYRSLYDIVEVKGHLLSIHGLKRSGFLLDF